MKVNTINPMDDKEFEAYTQKIVDVLGDDISGFFTLIHDVFEYFEKSDAIIEKTQTSLEEFEVMTEEIIGVLGKEEATRFFKAVYNALPKKTTTYLGVMIKVFEKMFN
jgi:hypothetical protein